MNDQWGKGAKYWDHAWNPVIGCKPVSEGCEHCYAKGMSERFPDLQDGNGGFEPHPVKAKTPPRKGVVFVGNMTDIMGEWNDPDEVYDWIGSLSPEAVNLILTKRPEIMNQWDCLPYDESMWLGITGENHERLEQRLDPFLRVAHDQRWLSLEPLLGEICLNSAFANVTGELGNIGEWVQWVVVGGESLGNLPGRECRIEWIEQIVQQCRSANVPVFVKQIHLNGNLVKDINKFPPHLQIRQVPWAKEL